MNQHPIIFNAENILAIRQGRKTQTRRVIKFPEQWYTPDLSWLASVNLDGQGDWIGWGPTPMTDEDSKRLYPEGGGIKCPYGKPGDLLRVRETWNADVNPGLGLSGQWFNEIDKRWRKPDACVHTYYRADGAQHIVRQDYPNIGDTDLDSAYYGDDFILPDKWMSPIFMPKWATRMHPPVISVRVERLLDISLEDILAEGISLPAYYADFLLDERAARSREDFAEMWDGINSDYPWSRNWWVWVVEFEEFTDG